MQRWILSRTFKRDINNDYGIYPENGDDVVMEAVDRNNEYEQQATGGQDQGIGRQLSDNENEYDRMYDADYQAIGRQVSNNENEYDGMYEADDQAIRGQVPNNFEDFDLD